MSTSRTTPATSSSEDVTAPVQEYKPSLTVDVDAVPHEEPSALSVTPKVSSTPHVSTNIFVAGIPPTWTDETLREKYSVYGEVVSTRVVKNRHFGFVMFRRPECAHAAINATHLTRPVPGGSTLLHVSIAMHDEGVDDEPNERIFVRGLPQWTTKEHLNKCFSQFGVIQESAVLMNQMGQCKGSGFVQFSKLEEAMSVINHDKPLFIEGSSDKLEVKYSESAEVRQQRQERNRNRQKNWTTSPKYGGGGYTHAQVFQQNPPSPQPPLSAHATNHQQQQQQQQQQRGGSRKSPVYRPPSSLSTPQPQQPLQQPHMGFPPYAVSPQPLFAGAVGQGNGTPHAATTGDATPFGTMPPNSMPFTYYPQPQMLPSHCSPGGSAAYPVISYPLTYGSGGSVSAGGGGGGGGGSPQGQGPMQIIYPPTSNRGGTAPLFSETRVIVVSKPPLPQKGDLHLSGGPLTAEIARALVESFGAVDEIRVLESGAAGVAVRMQDPTTHFGIAQQLCGTRFSTGEVLSAGLYA